tara:strand:- start:2049 stop:2708 length:660 start_codon:yes stop_codon:yes gene_type:complete
MKIFIPIKHNSQRVYRKNFRVFGREPLFKHTLLKYTDQEVYVDTDSQEIIDMISSDRRLKNVTVYSRKEELRGDKVSVCDLIKDFIKTYNVTCPVVQIHVTSPFLKKKTILDAVKFINTNDSVVSCNSYQSRFWRKEEYGFCPVNHNPVKMEQTQDLPAIYEENSAFYIFHPEAILNTNSRIGKNPHFYTISIPENIDIDIESDWEMANLLIKKGTKNL